MIDYGNEFGSYVISNAFPIGTVYYTHSLVFQEVQDPSARDEGCDLHLDRIVGIDARVFYHRV
jgi:hypothetical protein